MWSSSYGRFSTGMHNVHTRVKLEAAKKHPKDTWGRLAFSIHLGNAYLELPKASVAASLAKKIGTNSGRVRRSNAATKALWLYSYHCSSPCSVYS